MSAHPAPLEPRISTLERRLINPETYIEEIVMI
jgi:hypothetical protein